ncbi:hypothetical protein, partial [Streptococcus anginosus]|uniref:hypothetical protein n=1 Tax=Streptococcus anginosus TaxID=1328 RepID=UPI002EDAEA8F
RIWCLGVSCTVSEGAALPYTLHPYVPPVVIVSSVLKYVIGTNIFKTWQDSLVGSLIYGGHGGIMVEKDWKGAKLPLSC